MVTKYRNAKLIDFGVSAHERTGKTGDVGGTPMYIAPEVLNCKYCI